MFSSAVRDLPGADSLQSPRSTPSLLEHTCALQTAWRLGLLGFYHSYGSIVVVLHKNLCDSNKKAERMTMAMVEHEENYDSLGLQKKDERPLAVRDTTERKPQRMPAVPGSESARVSFWKTSRSITMTLLYSEE
jgi:hypothetical protein